MKKKRPQKQAQEPRTLNIELEEDADRLFQEAVENFSETQWKVEKKSKRTVPPQAAPRSQSPSSIAELDLHGLTLEQAKDAVQSFIQEQMALGSHHKTLKIITGKGRHSGTKGGILSREVHSFVVKKYQNIIVNIESAPADTEVKDGVLWRGHFHLTIRCS